MFLRSLLITILAFCVTTVPCEAAKATKKNGSRNHGLMGTVVNIEKDKDGGAILIIKPEIGRHARSRNKTGSAVPSGENAEHKIKIGSRTKIELVSGNKASRETKPGTLADLQQGERVMIRGGGESSPAEVIMIHAHAGKKKRS
jgi:hypothetical protein